jgi:hypothetical protein
MVNTGVVSTLMCFYHESTELRLAGSLYLAYLLTGILIHEHNTMHWASDIVAGTLMGYAIGSTIGRDFRNAWDGEQRHVRTSGVSLSPFIQSGYRGIEMSVAF